MSINTRQGVLLMLLAVMFAIELTFASVELP